MTPYADPDMQREYRLAESLRVRYHAQKLRQHM
jgi:hypothetical protein